MSFVLVSPNGDRRFALGGAGKFVVGRELSCDVPILEPGISRRHAELTVGDDEVAIVDLASRNGTWLNGERINRARASANDAIAFGAVRFTLLREDSARRLTPRTVPAALDGSLTVMRERPMISTAQALADVAGRRLSKLVLVAQRLGELSTVDALLQAIVDQLFDVFDADRVAVLLAADGGVLETRVARDRNGEDAGRPVPRAIAQGVADRQVALLTHDATTDSLTAGQSVLQQSVRSAMAAPLLDESNATVGVLYVDNLRGAYAFTPDDLDFLVAFAGIAVASVGRESSAERLRVATQARNNLERYFTPSVASRIASDSGAPRLGGVRQSVVVLFSDIRGFTAVAESLPPTQMAAQLNEYFAAMVDCVFRHEGALDKFIGDALMAYWGVPETHPDDVDRAVDAALDMQRALTVLNRGWSSRGDPTLTAGIGIHCGDAFVGNIGSPRRLEFTLIGDTVNVANRLCGKAKGSETLVSDAVRARLTYPHRLERREAFRPPSGSVALPVWNVSGEPDIGRDTTFLGA